MEAAATASTRGCCLRRKCHEQNLQSGGDDPADPEGGSSSGSSTLEGTEDLPMQIKDFDEETPLLHDGHALRPFHPRRSLMKFIESFMICQPYPIPVVNKVLPCNAYTIIIIGFVVLNIFIQFII
jgi:hypothetical protein